MGNCEIWVVGYPGGGGWCGMGIVRRAGVEGEGRGVLCRRCSCASSCTGTEGLMKALAINRRTDRKCPVVGARVKTWFR